MWYADDRGFGHAFVVIDASLDFFWIDVVTTADDHVFGAANDADVIVFADLRQISGLEVAIFSKILRGLFRRAPISFEHIVAAHLQFADSSRRYRPPVLVRDARRHPGQWRSDRAGDAPAIERVRGVHPGFGHAVAFQDEMAGALMEFVEGLLQ